LRNNEGDLEKKYRDEAYIMDIYYIFAAKFTIMDTATLNNIDTDDDALYSYLLQTRPDGNIMISDAEQKELLERLKERSKSSID
jgi:hypothetical protein